MTGNAEELEVAGRTVRLTNPDKIYFPQRGFTKRRRLRLLPRGRRRASCARCGERPTTLQRFPEGIEGEMFFQKRIPARGVPPWIETAKIKFPSGRTADELCPADLAHVAWAAQLGTIVFHPWPVRGADVDRPDELRIDLDPQPGTDFADAVTVAGEVRAILAELGWRRLPEDLRRSGRARLRPDRSTVDIRAGAPGRDRARPGDRAAPPRSGHHQVVEGGARRAGLRRLQPDGPGPHHRLRLLAAGQPAGDRVARRSPGTS